MVADLYFERSVRWQLRERVAVSRPHRRYIINNLDPLPHDAVVEDATLFAEPLDTDSSDAKTQATAVAERAHAELTDRQQLIVSHLTSDPIHVDLIIERTSLSAQDILQDLTLLSLKGVVKRVDGQSFVRSKGAAT